MKINIKQFLLISLLLFLGTTSFQGVVFAQEEAPIDDEDFATYIVQPGDTLASIAYQFGTSLGELIEFNKIENPNILPIGTELTLPGIIDVEGILTTIIASLGDTLNSLSVQYDIPVSTLVKINKIVNPIELYKGASLIIPIKEELEPIKPLINLSTNRTMLEESVLAQQSQWEIARANQRETLWDFLPGELIYSYSQETGEVQENSAIAALISNIEITPDKLTQGTIATIRVETNEPIQLLGNLGDRKLNFFEESPNIYVAYTGIHALTEPGTLPFSISSLKEDKTLFAFEQMLIAYDVYYGSESLIVDSQTIDLDINEEENELVFSLVELATEEKYWSAPFSCVVDQPVCIRSWYGTDRDYNDGMFYNFHSGIDYGVCASLNIIAPANGIVVFTGPLVVRGNATFIDHGWGVYSAFYHQSEILIEEGQFVSQGQIIGVIGTTGRSTGAHLHYDLFVNGVHVNPLNLLDPNCQ
ncbi:MAG: peptidoglycan DD-metalloendopeptidase family protein [Anaerolineaceae bacterium]|nr:peptidoglycan DD-metalloendopeptidase family protein [Anaerolineaceae bacterium]